MGESEFSSAKNALLKYFSDLQNSLGLRLFAFSVLLFSLFQIASWNNNKGLTALMDSNPYVSAIRLGLFFSAVLFVLIYMVRTVFRYASISGICNQIIILEPFDSKYQSIQAAICYTIYPNMVLHEKKVFYEFPFQWFVGGTICSNDEANNKFIKKENRKGWLVSFGIAFGLLILFISVYYKIFFP
jgi:hypothetical protein